MMDVLATNALEHRLAQRLRTLRLAQDLSLEALAQRSGVSRSMISVIERGQSHATAVVLDKLATALGVSLASLFEPAVASVAAEPQRVARWAAQPVWTDPGSGYLRRSVSPGGVGQPFQIVEVAFPAGARVAYETSVREPVLHQQVWLLAGRMEVSWGDEQHLLEPGDCLAMVLDRPTMFHNPGGEAARYAVVISVPPPVRGAQT